MTFRILIALVLISGISLPFCTSLGLNLFQRYQLKKQLQYRMGKADQSMLTSIGFGPNQQPEWEEENEFEYQGKMYDVVDLELIGDSIVYHCWPDDEESYLNKKLEDFLDHYAGHPVSTKNKKRPSPPVFKCFFESKNDNDGKLICVTNSFPAEYSTNYVSPVSPVDIPPPRLV